MFDDHVVIFDEAQRAWNLRKTADFMLRKKKRPGFTPSEPAFLISYLDRHRDWAVVVCLEGGGQEDAVREMFPGWDAYISPELHALIPRGDRLPAQDTSTEYGKKSSSLRGWR